MTGSGRLRRVLRFAEFLAFYLREVVKANVLVARHVLSPRLRARPALIAVPLDDRRPHAIAFLGNLLTMMPGTLSVEVGRDDMVLYVHVLHAENPGTERERIKREFERRVREVLS